MNGDRSRKDARLESGLAASVPATVTAPGDTFIGLDAYPTFCNKTAPVPTLQGSEFDAWKANAYNYLISNVPDSCQAGPSTRTVFRPASAVRSAPTGQTVSVQVSANVPMWSAGPLPTMTNTGGASRQAVRRNETNLERVMVLNDTGSTVSSATGNGGASKSQALRDAAGALVTLMLGDGTAPPLQPATHSLISCRSRVP
jgi:hypothetical protein